MKKAFDQTVRDLKRGVNKKVLKVPGIEQKVLDATSNEPWGPHGTLLADIAQASRNYHEYQMIMGVIWKRINDTGKNWRHVYKALTVLEYLVAHGSERVIDDIREHAYQISTLSDFQYIDSSGRDQGNNVRKKSQGLVILVNDKERIAEVRQKASANREKFHNVPSAGGMHRPSAGYGDRYEEDRYGSKEEEGYGRERDREWGYRDEDRYSRNGDSYGRDGDRYSRDSEDRYSRDNYRDDNMGGRSRSVEDFQYASRSRSHDGDRDRGLDDDGQHSSRGSVGRADEGSQDDRNLDRKFSEQNIGAPPSYEDAVSESRSPIRSEKDVESSVSSIPKPSSPPVINDAKPPAEVVNTSVAPPPKQEVETFDEFDPRGPLQGATSPQNTTEMDLLGSLSDSFSPNPLAIMPAPSSTGGPEADPSTNNGFGTTFAAASSPSVLSDNNQAFDDPFGDSPFKAIPSIDGAPVQPQTTTPANSFQSVPNDFGRQSENFAPTSEAAATYDFGGSLSGLTYTPGTSNIHPSPPDPQAVPAELSNTDQSLDILADILPPSGPYPVTSPQPPFYNPNGQSSQSISNPYGDHSSHPGSAAQIPQMQSPGPIPYNNNPSVQPAQSISNPYGDHISQPGSGVQVPRMQSPGPIPYNNNPSVQPAQSISNPYEDHISQPGSGAQVPQMQSPGPSHYTNNPNMHPAHSISNPYGDHVSQTGSAAQIPQMESPAHLQYNNGNFQSQMGYLATMNVQPQFQTGVATPPAGGSFHPQIGSGALQHPQMASNSMQPTSMPGASYLPPGSSVTMGNSHSVHQQGYASPAAPQVPQNSSFGSPTPGNFVPQAGQSNVQTASAEQSLALVPQPSQDKFQTKSTVWADTLSRGLVNLNISGPKTNPLSDIGVDFDAINRKEKRMEKQPAAPVTSTVTMGKAMGSGSGMGRAGVNSLRAPPNPMMGSGMGMGMGMGLGAGGGQGSGMGMGGYGGMNQPMGMGSNAGYNMGMGANMGYNNMGMGANIGYNHMGMGMNNRPMMGQGGTMQQGTGLPPGSSYPGGYNPMMGGGSAYPQQPYGGGYR